MWKLFLDLFSLYLSFKFISMCSLTLMYLANSRNEQSLISAFPTSASTSKIQLISLLSPFMIWHLKSKNIPKWIFEHHLFFFQTAVLAVTRNVTITHADVWPMLIESPIPTLPLFLHICSAHHGFHSGLQYHSVLLISPLYHVYIIRLPLQLHCQSLCFIPTLLYFTDTQSWS